jgi:hypothetical protein
VALQDNGTVAQRLGGRDCGLDVAPDLEKISVLTCSSCCLVLIDSAAKPRADRSRAVARSCREPKLPPLPCTCTSRVVIAGGFASGCHRAAATWNPSIALIDRNRSSTPGGGRMSSGSPSGRGVSS